MARVACLAILFSAASLAAETIWTTPPSWNGVQTTSSETRSVSARPLRLGSGALPRQVSTQIEPLNSGEVYRLCWSGRTVRGPNSLIRVVVGPLTPRTKSTSLGFGAFLTSKETDFSVPFEIPADLAGKQIDLHVCFDEGDAIVEVQGVRIESLGAEKPLTAYQRTGRWYQGQEFDAAWRQKARQRIETHRKGDLTVRVVDCNGNPVDDVRVIAEQQSHSYRFGVAVNSRLWRFMPGAEGVSPQSLNAEFDYYRTTSGRTNLTLRTYQKEIKTYFDVLTSDFNFVVFENAMKWEAWSNAWGGFSRQNTLDLMNWLARHGIGIKLHALIWPGWRHMPEFVRPLQDSPEALRNVIDAHFTELALALNGKVETVDVMNETFSNNDLMKVLGDQEMAEWYRRADQLFPNAQLNMNEFLLMANGGAYHEKLDFYDSLIARLLSENAPLEGLGFQGHFRHAYLTAPERIWELCDRFGRFGLPLICSEFDVNLPDEQLQADYTLDFLTAWFAHPDTQAFIQWGFWQGSHWLPYAGLYDVEWRMKPNAKIYRDLVYNQWWSGWEEGRTSREGSLTLRGFLGTYRVSIYANGREKVLDNVLLNKEGTVLTVQL